MSKKEQESQSIEASTAFVILPYWYPRSFQANIPHCSDFLMVLITTTSQAYQLLNFSRSAVE